MNDEFCLIHGYDYMVKDSMFGVFSYCQKCEEEHEEKQPEGQADEPKHQNP